MLIPSAMGELTDEETSLSRRVNANSQRNGRLPGYSGQAYQEG